MVEAVVPPSESEMTFVPLPQEYEAELEMLQDQKKTYEEKMEEYEALQLQKKVRHFQTLVLSSDLSFHYLPHSRLPHSQLLPSPPSPLTLHFLSFSRLTPPPPLTPPSLSPSPLQDYEAKLSELESALVKELRSGRSTAQEKVELQRNVSTELHYDRVAEPKGVCFLQEMMSKLEQLEGVMTQKQKEVRV